MQNDTQKQRNILKAKFFPSEPTNYEKLFSPSPRDFWYKSRVIVDNSILPTRDKIALLLDFYGKYFLCQQKEMVDFAVCERFYNRYISSETNDEQSKKDAVYQYFVKQITAGNNYVVNRELKDQLSQILQQSKNWGIAKQDIVKDLDSKSRAIVTLAEQLKEDYSDRLLKQIYQPTTEEVLLKNHICERFCQNHPDHISLLPEVMIDPNTITPMHSQNQSAIEQQPATTQKKPSSNNQTPPCK